MNGPLLVLNAGSSSLKFQLFEAAGAGQRMVRRGQIEGIGVAPRFFVRDADARCLVDQALPEGLDPPAALAHLLDWLGTGSDSEAIAAVGHRVVHGGARYARPLRVTEALLEELHGFIALAPLHQPFNLAPIRALLDHHPELPQVVCFDTAFHRSQPILAELFALPIALYEEGVRRYGFHGLSYEYIARRLRMVAPEIAGRRVVVGHLGNGVSLCAMIAGRSVATTMGFTALDGLPMGTRCGELDPGVVIHLARDRRMALDEIESMLYRQSGLLGLSGESSDMRALLASTSAGSRLAVDYFVYRIARATASLAAAMEGIDALVFTAGIGENSPVIRARVVQALQWLGLELDAPANQAGAVRISRPDSRVSAWIIATDEEQMIAEHTRDVLKAVR